MPVDIARRAYDHTFRIDPIVRTLMDTDFYKLLMQQMILALHPDVRTRFRLIVRTKSVRLAEVIDERELRDQLDHARSLRFQPNELIWLAGNTFYGQQQIFSSTFVDWLSRFQLPEYELSVEDGNYVLEFHATWAEATAWEIPALAIVNELRARAAMRDMNRFELDVLYARAKAKLWDKLEILRELSEEHPGEVRISDFGTRRRHGFLWQRWCIEAARSTLGPALTGTSNVSHAMDLGLEAVGTNAHELPMVYAALSDGDDELRDSPYRVLSDWAAFYGERLRIILPDAFGSTNFLRNAPDWVADWTGYRPDSKDPVVGTLEYVEWIRSRGRDPREKVSILSDGMDVPKIVASVRRLHGEIAAVPIGWGTNMTNDFVGCSPVPGDTRFDPISIVCKVVEANGRPAVKLSDNPSKATGPREEIERYLRVFGTDGMQVADVVV